MSVWGRVLERGGRGGIEGRGSWLRSDHHLVFDFASDYQEN